MSTVSPMRSTLRDQYLAPFRRQRERCPPVESCPMRSLEWMQRGLDMLVTIRQHTTDHKRAVRCSDTDQVFGKLDQRRGEDVGNDDVELAIGVSQRSRG